MNILKKIVFAITLLFIPLTVNADSYAIPAMREDIEHDIPLADAIKEANERYPSRQPLTEDEVIAAVRAMKLKDPDISEAIYKIYQRVANERILPRGMFFSHIGMWTTEYGHFVVDWKDLSLMPLPPGTKDPDIGYGYNYRIRARFISWEPVEVVEVPSKLK